MKATLFGRKKSDVEVPPTHEVKEGGKGRPTPKRKEAEAAARARAKAPRTRKELAKRDREVRAESSRKMREAMKTGDERYLPARDRGPIRRFVRDFVDRRFTMIEMLIPLLLVTMVLGWTGEPALVQASTLVLMVTVLVVVVDLLILRFLLRKELRRRFPDESLKGTTYYASMRALQMKFMRMPKAQVKVGQTLPDDYR